LVSSFGLRHNYTMLTFAIFCLAPTAAVVTGKVQHRPMSTSCSDVGETSSSSLIDVDDEVWLRRAWMWMWHYIQQDDELIDDLLNTGWHVDDRLNRW